MLLHVLPSGDEVHRYDYAIVIPFKGKRKVLSTSPLNGGYREDLKAVFNYDYERLGRAYEHILNIDTHRPFVAAGVPDLIERIAPGYLTFELISGDRTQHDALLREQVGVFRKQLNYLLTD